MLDRRHRLSDRRAIQQVHRRGQLKRGHHLTVKALAQPPAHPAKLAVIVSSRVAKQATERNRLRRRLQAACEQIVSQLTAGFNILVIINSRQALNMEFTALENELSGCLRAIGALH